MMDETQLRELLHRADRGPVPGFSVADDVRRGRRRLRRRQAGQASAAVASGLVVAGIVGLSISGRAAQTSPSSDAATAVAAGRPDGSAVTPTPGASPSGAIFTLNGKPLSGEQVRQAYQPATTMADPEKAYADCVALVREQAQRSGLTAPEGVSGRVAASNGVVTTVVVANDQKAWTCNVAPDSSVSNPSSATPQPSAAVANYVVALNAAQNYGQPADAAAGCAPGSAVAPPSTTLPQVTTSTTAPHSLCKRPSGPWSGQLLWAGGRLPVGVTGLGYTLPDGRTVPAVVADGYWVLQDLSETDWTAGVAEGLVITVHLSDGRTVSVPLGPDTMCNQTTHGC